MDPKSGVVLVGTAQVRETVGIERVQHEHAHSGAGDGRQERFIVQQRDLAARAAKALDAVRARAQEQNAGSALLTELGPIDRQFLPFRAAFARVHVAEYARPGCARGGEELIARLAIGLRKMRGGVHGGG